MKKILIIRFSSIGDIVLTSPVLRCLKTQLDEVSITFATKKEYSSILEPNPYVDKVLSLDNDWHAFKKAVHQESYDVVVDLHRNLRSFRLRKGLTGKHYKVDKLNFKKYLLVRFKKDLLPSKHVVDRYLETVESLNINNDGEGIDFFIPEATPYLSVYPAKKSYRAYCIGAQFGTKKMPKEKILELTDREKGALVLIGGTEDDEVAQWVLHRTRNKKAQSFCGKTDLLGSALLVKHATGVYTHDTGMMHIASAFDVPILSVWGNTVPALGMYPYRKMKTDRMEVEGLSCRPCSKIGYSSCPKKHFKCMDHNVESMIEKMDTLEATGQ